MSRESRSERLARRQQESEADDRRSQRFFLAIVAAFVVVVVVVLLVRFMNSGPLDLNAAPAAKLETLPGIGPETAKAIIKGRPYESIEDLDRVKGIGPATIKKLRDKVKVEE